MKLYKHFVLFNTSKWLDGTGSYFINFSMHLNHLKGLNFWFTDSKMKLEISSWFFQVMLMLPVQGHALNLPQYTYNRISEGWVSDFIIFLKASLCFHCRDKAENHQQRLSWLMKEKCFIWLTQIMAQVLV